MFPKPQTIRSKAKTTGRKGEVEVAKLAERCGCIARVTARRQTKHSSLVADVTIEADGRNIRLEVKRRRSIPEYLFSWLQHNDACILREDGPKTVDAPGKHGADDSRWLAILPAEMYFQLLAEVEELRKQKCP